MRSLILSLGTALMVGLPVPGAAQDAAATECPSCGGILLSNTLVLQAQKPPSAKLKIDPKDKELFKPMSRGEIKQLIEAYAAAAAKGGKGSATDRMVGHGLTMERTVVLTQDVLILLARVHMRETVAGLRKTGGSDEEALKASIAIDDCARGRYRDFGGDPALERSLEIVLASRKLLEQLILEPLIPLPGPLGPKPLPVK